MAVSLRDKRRPVLKSEEFDSDPRQLRASIARLEELLEGCETQMCRRVRLMFGDLVANWQESFAGESISLSFELVPNTVRLNVGNGERPLTDEQWDDLITRPMLDLVDDWGEDRRSSNHRWFEFREGHPGLSRRATDPTRRGHSARFMWPRADA